MQVTFRNEFPVPQPLEHFIANEFDVSYDVNLFEIDSYLLPWSSDPSERMNARILALANLLRLLIFRNCQVRAEFWVDACSVLNWVGVVSRSRV